MLIWNDFYIDSRDLRALDHSHSICVFDSKEPSNRNYEPWRMRIYRKIDRYISDGYAVVYIAEENVTATIRHFLGMGITVEDYIQSGALTIINNNIFYSPAVESTILLNQWNKIFSGIEKRFGVDFKGFVGIGMPADLFFISDSNQQRLIEYESVAAEKYNRRIEAMCLYTTNAFEKMPLRYVIRLLNAHQNTVHGGEILRPWNAERCLAVIKRSFEESLGSSVSEMVYDMLTRDFEMNTEEMILRPEKFERKLRILLGDSAADIVIARTTMDLLRDVTF